MNEGKSINNFRQKQLQLESFKDIFYKYHGRLVLFANKFTGDMEASRDLVQDAFLKLWEKSDSVSIKSPKAYLFQAVRNNCLNYARHINIKRAADKKLAEEMKKLENSIYFESADPLKALFEKEIENKIQDLVQSMPEKCRKVYQLSRNDYLKNKEIAIRLGISVKMVEKHISKALRILRSGVSEHIGILLLVLFKNI